MLNSVDGESEGSPAGRRTRMAPADRRRQLVGLGLARLVEAPGDELPVEAIAREAGISRSLLFHYFPTKADFHAEVIAAAGRRMLRTVRPPEDLRGEAAVRHLATAFVEQVARRRAFYLALRRGAMPLAAGTGVHETLRDAVTDVVVATLGLTPAQRPAVHAWWAYLEDLAVERTAGLGTDRLVEHALAVLDAVVTAPGLGRHPAR
jgi:AcrR family transcriptional regulator